MGASGYEREYLDQSREFHDCPALSQRNFELAKTHQALRPCAIRGVFQVLVLLPHSKCWCCYCIPSAGVATAFQVLVLLSHVLTLHLMPNVVKRFLALIKGHQKVCTVYVSCFAMMNTWMRDAQQLSGVGIEQGTRRMAAFD
jgi:hypothetical protein